MGHFWSSQTGYTSPSYQWKVNGDNVGTNSSELYYDSWNYGINYISLTISEDGYTGMSNTIYRNVLPRLTPSVTITTNEYATIENNKIILCSHGLNYVCFTANPIQGGASPTYQWYVNGSPAGVGQTLCHPGGLSNGGNIYVVMTVVESCTTTNTVICFMETILYQSYPTDIEIVSDTVFPVEPGTTVNMHVSYTSASGTSEGTVFKWFVNNTDSGQRGKTFSSNTLQDGDIVYCCMTTDYPCIIPGYSNPVCSNSITAVIEVLYNATLEGHIQDSSGAGFLSNVRVDITLSNQSSYTTYSNSSGYYNFTSLLSIDSIIVASRSDYDTWTGTKKLNPGYNLQNITMSKPIQGGQLRFILSWNEECDGTCDGTNCGDYPDMDLHVLTAPASDNKRYHVCWSQNDATNGECYENNVRVPCPCAGYREISKCNLEYDSRCKSEFDRHGAETIRVIQNYVGTYNVYVNMYEGSHPIKGSNSEVRIYNENGAVATINIGNAPDPPPNTDYRCWDVASCYWNGSAWTITAINELCEFGTPDYILNPWTCWTV